MDDLIKRSEVIKNIDEVKKSPLFTDDLFVRNDIAMKNAAEMIKVLCVNSAPAVEAEPVVHAYWIMNHKNSSKQCSACHKRTRYLYDFCPHCGAKMDALSGEDVI